MAHAVDHDRGIGVVHLVQDAVGTEAASAEGRASEPVAARGELVVRQRGNGLCDGYGAVWIRGADATNLRERRARSR